MRRGWSKESHLDPFLGYDVIGDKQGYTMKNRHGTIQHAMVEGYKAMVEENRRFAKEALPLAAEVWDAFEVEPKPRRKGRKR
jgi:hypothetical protein